MKKALTLVILILIVSCCINAAMTQTARNVVANIVLTQDSTPEWSDERFKAYEDSLLKALYPEVRECHLPDSVIRKDDTRHAQPVTYISSEISNPILPDIVLPDRTKSPGEIEIRSGVTPTGARTYEVPIKAYPGINGFQPNLSLLYNSQAGNSVAGHGWTIAGIPTITRSGKSIYYDSTCEGVKMDLTDSFILDGVKLVITSDNADHILYESEQGNIIVKGYVSGNVLQYFEVSYPDGSKARFGYVDNTVNRLQYPITAISDIRGNRISYTYEETGGCNYITRIEYNGAAIDFSYTKRTDPFSYYGGGVQVTVDKRLEGLKCRKGLMTLCEYILGYTTLNDVTHLNRITYSADGESFNPLQFIYGEGRTNDGYDTFTTRLMSSYTSEDPKMIKAVRGRFDSGNYDDGIIVLPNKNPYWQHHKGSGIGSKSENRYDNLYTGEEKIFVYGGLSESFADPLAELSTGKGFIDIMCADLDGNGEDYVIKVNNFVERLLSADVDRVSFSVYRYDSTYGLVKLYERFNDYLTFFTDESGARSIQPKFYYPGDFNGDGRMEILCISASQPFGGRDHPTQCHVLDFESEIVGRYRTLYSGHPFDLNLQFVGNDPLCNNPENVYNNSDKLLVFDVDGDGKTDICLVNRSGVHVYSFSAAQDGSLDLKEISSSSVLTRSMVKDCDLLPGDFNGDGLVDMMLSPSKGTAGDNNLWMVFYSMGNGEFRKDVFSGTGKGNIAGAEFITQDIDGDGRSDLIKYSASGFNTYPTTPGGPGAKGFYTAFPSANSILVPSEINNRNRTSRLMALKGTTVTKYSPLKEKSREHLLTGMINSFGLIEKNEYKSLCDTDNAVYEYNGNANKFPYVNLRVPMMVLARTELSYNTAPFGTANYGYEDAVFHRQGRGFMGFSKIKYCDNRGNLTIQTFDPYNHGILKSIVSPESEITNNYDIRVEPNRIRKIQIDTKTEKNLLTGYSADYSYTYDQYGFPTEETIAYSDDITVKTSMSYYHDSRIDGAYSLGFMTDRTITTSRGEDEYVERTHFPEFEYRQPISEVRYVNGNQIQRTDYYYNGKGNIIKETVTPFDSPHSLTTEYDYTTDGLLTEETDPWGILKSYTLDHCGRITDIEEHTGNTYIKYDSFGREILRTYPDGTERKINYEWVNHSTRSIYRITTETTGKPTESEYYDALGRVVQQTDTRFDGKIRKIDREYDIRGDLARESEPYTGNAPTAWTTYEYDTHGRMLTASEPSGRETRHVYSGSSVKTWEDEVEITRTYDSQGNFMSSSDDAGPVRYYLAADGKPDVAESLGGINIWINYDKYRRYSSIGDSGFGNIRYEYDSWGNVRKRVCEGKEITYEYDDLNRLKKVVTPELSTSYTYDEYSRLTGVVSSNRTSSSVTYDQYGRLKSYRENAPDGKWLRKDYSYTDGNVCEIKYTSQDGEMLTEKYVYSNGTFCEGVVGETSVYRLVSEDSTGIPSEVETGGITREYYNEHGFPKERKARCGETVLQDVAYEFDPATSNLTCRRNLRHGTSERFGYDKLDRLVSAGEQTYSYNILGNMTERSNVGRMEYKHFYKPHAVTDLFPDGEFDMSSTQELGHASFSRPEHVSEGRVRTSFVYNADADRVKTLVESTSQSSDKFTIRTSYYLGDNYEWIQDSINPPEERLYLFGDYYDATAVCVKKGSKVKTHYILRDHLGSVTHVTDSTGDVLQEVDYDAWGMMRRPENLEYYGSDNDSSPNLILGRGFTGHEHLRDHRLINMNARLYDPLTCRFLAPDPQMQFPDFSQGHNRFSYALNNPIRYVDEDGEFLWFVVGAAVIGGVINVATHWDAIQAGGFWAGAKYFATGAIAGGVGAAAGIGIAGVLGGPMMGAVAGTTGFVNGMITSATFGASSGFILGTGNSLIQGESFGSSLVNGLTQGAIDGLINGVAGGIGGGVKAINRGRNFWTGKYSNETLVYRAGLLAKKSIEGSGHVVGTKRHTHASKLLKKYQKVIEKRELKTNLSEEYLGRNWYPDVVDKKYNIIYDWKFGYPNKTAEQLNQTRQMRMYRKAFKMNRSKIFKY